MSAFCLSFSSCKSTFNTIFCRINPSYLIASDEEKSYQKVLKQKYLQIEKFTFALILDDPLQKAVERLKMKPQRGWKIKNIGRYSQRR